MIESSIRNLDVFFKNSNVTTIAVGDKIKVTIFLELPENSNGNDKKGKERTQVFEGTVISKHLRSDYSDATVTVRKMFQGGGAEKVFVLNSPWIKSIDIVNNSIVRRSKLYYLRKRTGKSARLKRRRS